MVVCNGTTWWPSTYLSVEFVPKVPLELRCRVQVAQQLRVEREHDDAQRDEGRPADGCRVQPDRFPEAQQAFEADGLEECKLVIAGCVTRDQCCARLAISRRCRRSFMVVGNAGTGGGCSPVNGLIVAVTVVARDQQRRRA